MSSAANPSGSQVASSVPGEQQASIEAVQPDESVLLSVAPLDPAFLLALPDPDVDGAEGMLGQANERRLSDATDRLEQVIPGLAGWLSEFRPGAGTDVPGTAISDCPIVVPHHLPTSGEEWWEVIDRVIHHDDARAGRIAIDLTTANDGVDAEVQFDTTYDVHRPSVGRLAEKLAGRAAVLLRSVGRNATLLDSMAADLETLLGVAVEVDLLAFGAGATHLDPADRGGRLLVMPLDTDIEAATVTTEVEVELDVPPPVSVAARPGLALLANSGVTVRMSSDNLGLALRVVLPEITPASFLQQASAAARYHPLLRADLPADFDAPIESYSGSLYSEPGAFHREVSLALGTFAKGHAAGAFRAAVPPHPSNDLEVSLEACRGSLPRLRSPIVGGVVVTNLHGQLAIVAAGLVVAFADDFLTVLAPHLDGRAFDPGPLLQALQSAGPETGATGDDRFGEPPSGTRPPALKMFQTLLAAEVLEVA